MKKIYALIAIAMIIMTVSSCKKEDDDEGKLPAISFKTGGKYVSANKNVGQGDTVLVGINASKTEDKDVLKTLDVTRTYGGGTPTTYDNIALSGNDENVLSKDYKLVMRNQVGSETYSFTVVNRDGLTNTVSLTLTVL